MLLSKSAAVAISVAFSFVVLAEIQTSSAEGDFTQPSCNDAANPCVREDFLDTTAFGDLVYNIVKKRQLPNLECKESADVYYYADDSTEECFHCSDICTKNPSLECLKKCKSFVVKQSVAEEIEENKNMTNDVESKADKALDENEKERVGFIVAVVILGMVNLALVVGIIKLACKHKNLEARLVEVEKEFKIKKSVQSQNDTAQQTTYLNGDSKSHENFGL